MSSNWLSANEQPVFKIAKLAVAPQEPADLVLFAAKRPHDADARQVLLQQGRQPPFRFIDLLEQLPHLAKKHDRKQHDHGNHRQRQHRHPQILRQHDRDGDHEQQHDASDFHDLRARNTRTVSTSDEQRWTRSPVSARS